MSDQGEGSIAAGGERRDKPPGSPEETKPEQSRTEQDRPGQRKPESKDEGGRHQGAPAAEDPLRGSRVSGLWTAVAALVVLLVLLSVFVLQNTQEVQVTYFGWTGRAPLAAALLIAVAAGLLVAVGAGTLRILQLRRRVRRDRKG